MKDACKDGTVGKKSQQINAGCPGRKDWGAGTGSEKRLLYWEGAGAEINADSQRATDDPAAQKGPT